MPAAHPRCSSASASQRSGPGSAAEVFGVDQLACAPPLSVKAPLAALPSPGALPAIPWAVVAGPEAAAEGCVVEAPTTAALRLLQRTFPPLAVLRAPAGVFVVHARIAQGMHSAVYHVEDQREKGSALKVVPLWPPLRDTWLGTAALLARLRHRHIVHCLEHFRYVTHGVPFLCLRLQPCLRGSLADHLRRSRKGVSGPLAAKYITQLASALHYLHRQGILHGDVRADHVLLATHDEEVRLTGLTHGLGLHRRVPCRQLTVTGAPRLYAPPEWAESTFLGRVLHPTETPLPSYDMWALGCLLVELCTGTLLEDRLGLHGTPLSLDAAALAGAQQQMEAVHRGAFAPLSRGLLDVDAETRLSAEGVQRVARSAASKVGFWSAVMATVTRQP
eukprot:EG_transcript_4583